MRALNEIFKIFRAAVDAIGRKGKNAVVSPVALARKIGKRHQLEGSNSEIDKGIETIVYRRKSSGGRERAYVQLIDDGLLPRPAAPGFIMPIKVPRIDDFAGPMHITRLEAGGWIRNFRAGVDLKFVLRSGLCRVRD